MNSEEKSLFLLQNDQTCHPIYYYYYYIKFAYSLPPEVKPLPLSLKTWSVPQPVTGANVCRTAFSTAVLRTPSAAIGHCKMNWPLLAHPESHPKESWAWLCLNRKASSTFTEIFNKRLNISSNYLCCTNNTCENHEQNMSTPPSLPPSLPFLPSFFPSFLLSSLSLSLGIHLN